MASLKPAVAAYYDTVQNILYESKAAKISKEQKEDLQNSLKENFNDLKELVSQETEANGKSLYVEDAFEASLFSALNIKTARELAKTYKRELDANQVRFIKLHFNNPAVLDMTNDALNMASVLARLAAAPSEKLNGLYSEYGFIPKAINPAEAEKEQEAAEDILKRYDGYKPAERKYNASLDTGPHPVIHVPNEKNNRLKNR